MTNMAIVDLEEKALMMEFATAVAMERHYDLQARSRFHMLVDYGTQQ